MADRSDIEWTDATWNPTTGCTKVSRGCDNCYAEALAHRLLSDTYRRRLPVVQSPENLADPFAVRVWPDRLGIPRSWKAPRRVFVNSMSDLFHADVPELFVRRCFEAMLEADWHEYQILTKRPSRAARFVARNSDLFEQNGLPAHIWIGTSVEDQAVSHRIRHLLAVPAAVRFLSCEPLIGALSIAGDLEEPDPGVHWVIAGGESGVGARPMELSWARRLRDECDALGIPFFFKQWGGRTPKAGGRELDGRTWDEYPESRLASK